MAAVGSLELTISGGDPLGRDFPSRRRPSRRSWKEAGQTGELAAPLLMSVKPRTSENVSIVGGSAAGFFTAYLLTRRGLPVEVYEQGEALAPAARTLIVTQRMRDLLGPLGEGAVVNEIRRFELFTDGRAAAVPLQQPDLIIERAALIRGLAAHAQEAGAQIKLGRKFVNLEPAGNGLLLRLRRNGSGEEFAQARTVVGADGAASRVAQAAGWPRQHTAPLIQAVVRLPADVPADTVRVWFVPQDTPYFYWLIPESREQGVLGLIGEDGQETRRRLDAFLARHDLAPLSFQAAHIPLYTRWTPVERRLGRGRVFLVGDAAGQVKVTTVGGIVTGFRGALGVAEAILNHRAGPTLRSLRWELTVHLLLRRALHSFSQNDYSRLLDVLNGAALGLLGRHSRDEATRVLWQLCSDQPRLLLWGLRALLTGSFPRRNSA